MKPIFIAATLFCALASSEASAQAAAPKTLVVTSFGGGFDVVLKKVMEPFEKANNVKIELLAGASAQHLSRIVATKNRPEIDVFMSENMSIAGASKEGVLEKLDPKLVPNLKNAIPMVRFPNDEGIGFGVIAVGMYYKTDDFQKNGWPAPTSWQDFFDKKYCGRIGLFHPNVSHGIYLALMLSALERKQPTIGGKPLDSIEGSPAKLASIKDCISVLEPSGPKMEEKIQLGEYALGIHAQTRVLPLAARGYPIAFAYPKEGAITMLSSAAVVKNAPNRELAQKFVNRLLEPDAQKAFVEEFFYGPATLGVEVPAKMQEMGVPTPERAAPLIRIDDATAAAKRREWTRQIERAMAK
jgi:putative spermidine/putrescine transport system substrate-binding protein